MAVIIEVARNGYRYLTVTVNRPPSSERGRGGRTKLGVLKMMNGNGMICSDCEYMGFTCIGGRVSYSCHRPDFTDVSPCYDQLVKWLGEDE